MSGLGSLSQDGLQCLIQSLASDARLGGHLIEHFSLMSAVQRCLALLQLRQIVATMALTCFRFFFQVLMQPIRRVLGLGANCGGLL